MVQKVFMKEMSLLMKNKIFITGANGFIGRYICKKLSALGVDYLGMVRSNVINISNKNNYIECSLSDKDKLISILTKFQPNSVLHLAAIANPTFHNVTQIYDTNVTGTENLLNAIKVTSNKKVRVVLVSTAGVYGDQGITLLNEDCPYSPVNHYAYSKMVMEFLSRQYVDTMETCIVRPFNMIGYGQQENFLIPKLVKAFVNKDRILQVGNIETERDYVDADFAANAFVELLTRETLEYSTYNICSGIPTKGSDILRELANITNYLPKVEIAPEFIRKNEIWHMIGDPRRINDLMVDYPVPQNINKILTEIVNHYTKLLLDLQNTSKQGVNIK